LIEAGANAVTRLPGIGYEASLDSDGCRCPVRGRLIPKITQDSLMYGSILSLYARAPAGGVVRRTGNLFLH